jgi:hypothetical protein
MTVGVLYVLLVRFAVGNDKSARSKYCGPTGKRSAGKLACSVWSGGKAVRPYLSLFEVILCSALAAADACPLGAIHNYQPHLRVRSDELLICSDNSSIVLTQ